MTDTSALIPFGKYKNQPMQQLERDPAYCEWLLAQPWFVEKFPAIHTIIINHFGEPDETPAHNRLQLRFLDETFRRRSSHAALLHYGPRLWRDSHVPAWAPTYWSAPRLPEFEVEGKDVFWDVHYWHLYLEKSARTEQTWLGKQAEALWRGPTATSGNPWPRYNAFCKEHRDWLSQTITIEHYEWLPSALFSVAVECKPVLGDDYPAVLRFMRNLPRRPLATLLVVEEARSQAASLPELKTFFQQSNILLLTVADLDATPPLDCYAQEHLPNPLEPQG